MFSKYEIFDPNALTELFELQSSEDPTLVADLISDYLNQLEPNTAAIVNAFNNADPREVEALAHSLKSSSRVLGLIRMGEVCFLLEETGRERCLKLESLTSLQETSSLTATALNNFLTKSA